MQEIKFGTGGWRAIIADDFTKANIRRLSKGLALKMKKDGTVGDGVCIGYDRRFLSEVAAQWIAEVLAAEGIKSRIINRAVPTPLVMFAVKKMDLNYGMAITASHNPAAYNGVKVFTHGGRDADETVTADLEGYIAQVREEDVSSIDYAEGIKSGLIEEINPMNDYIDSILAMLDVEAIKKRNLKVVLDPMFGVSKTSLQTVLMTARCEVDVIHERRDTMFGGRLPAPSTETLRSLKQYVTEHGADLGIATDGDADRIGIIDDKERFVHPNEILVLLYYYLLKYKGWKGPAVRNIATTHLLDRVAEKFGEKCYEVPVGFKHISAKMTETNAVIGGESSGGLTVRGHISGKDGIFASSLLVEMMCVTGKSLSEIYKELTDEFGTFFMAEHDERFSIEKKEELKKLLFEEKKLPDYPLEIEKVSYLDGCKVYFKNGGWIIIRFSGTEPLLRSSARCQALSRRRKSVR